MLGWTGNKCDACAPRFGPPGKCSRCGTGWTGDNCDTCGFGLSAESKCTKCIQNSTWLGYVAVAGMVSYDIEVSLTFTGPDCSTVVSGKLQTISFIMRST